MDYLLTEDELAIRELCRDIADEHIIPKAAEYDDKQEFPWDIHKVLAEAGIYGSFIPEEYGGIGGNTMTNCIIMEELARGCGGICLAFGGSMLGMGPIVMFGSDEQKQKYLPGIASGEKLGAFALTEAEAGSDAAGIRTTARKEGDYYVLNGVKQWITNGPVADYAVVIAMTDRSRGARGATALIVEKEMPGYSVGKIEDKLGIRASKTSELVFEDVKVPAENVLSKEGRGFFVTMKNFDASRPGVAAQAVGIARRAVELSVEYSIERRQFGKPISSFQGLQFLLADMAMQVEAARSLVYSVARSQDAGDIDGGTSAMAKCFASDVAMKVTVDAVQVFGGYGYMREYPVEKLMRDAKITQIYEGTNQIQREIIALSLIKQARRRGK